MARIVYEGVEKQFDKKNIIEDFNLQVEDGEFIVLVGPSGCGKSTILRMTAGLEAVSRGNIFIGDRIVNDLTPRQRNVAMVFQNYALYPHKFGIFSAMHVVDYLLLIFNIERSLPSYSFYVFPEEDTLPLPGGLSL